MAVIRAIRASEVPKRMLRPLRELPRFISDQKRFRDDRQALLAKYDGQWVAIHRQKVVAHRRDFRQLIAALRKRGIKPSSAAIRLVTSEKRLHLF